MVTMGEFLSIDDASVADNAVLREARVAEKPRPQLFAVMVYCHWSRPTRIVFPSESIAVGGMGVAALRTRGTGGKRHQDGVSDLDGLDILADLAYNASTCRQVCLACVLSLSLN